MWAYWTLYYQDHLDKTFLVCILWEQKPFSAMSFFNFLLLCCRLFQDQKDDSAIAISNSHLTLQNNVTFLNNSAASKGGAISLRQFSVLSIQDVRRSNKKEKREKRLLRKVINRVTMCWYILVLLKKWWIEICRIYTVASGAEERGGSSAAWPCSYFSSFQPFRSYFHDHRDAKICDARS